jgi:acyl-coenzyme A thioesterase PaaI-like protein
MSTEQIPEGHFRRLERTYAQAGINQYYRPTLNVAEGRAEVVIPVRPDFFHAAHAVHGSVYFKALDDAAFFAVASVVQDVFVLTVGYTGEIRAVGRVVHRSKNLFLAEAELVDHAARQVGRGNGSFMRSTTPLSPDVGYA